MKNKSSNEFDYTELSKDDKTRLKSKITISIYNYIKRRQMVKYTLASAATIAILFAFGVFDTNKKVSSTIVDFAKTVKSQTPDHNVKLILSNNKKVEITEDNSTIAYSNSGQNVTIGTSKSVSQETLNYNSLVYNTLLVPYGKRSEIVLSDGSKVWLNSGSKLIFPAAFTSEKREVYLEGEAIFEIAYYINHPFIVKLENQDIEVLGTVFNVSNYIDDEAIFTVLKSGSIQLSYINSSISNPIGNIKITPNMLAIYNKKDNAIKTSTVDIEKYFSWRDGIFIFKNDSLRSIMKRIARYYNVEIEINDQYLANQTFSGYLDVKENIENVMKTIKETETSQFEYHMEANNKLIIN